MWGESILTATHLTNRSATNAIKNKTPYEMWYKSKPDVSKHRVFGTRAFVHVPKANRPKFDDVSYECVMVRYGPNGYRLWNLVTRKIVYSCDVKFNESKFG